MALQVARRQKPDEGCVGGQVERRDKRWDLNPQPSIAVCFALRLRLTSARRARLVRNPILLRHEPSIQFAGILVYFSLTRAWFLFRRGNPLRTDPDLMMDLHSKLRTSLSMLAHQPSADATASLWTDLAAHVAITRSPKARVVQAALQPSADQKLYMALRGLAVLLTSANSPGKPRTTELPFAVSLLM